MSPSPDCMPFRPVNLFPRDEVRGDQPRLHASNPLTLYGWAALLCVTSAATAFCLITASPIPLLVAATLLCLTVALVGALIVGFTLTSPKDVVRAALIGAGVLSLSAVLIPSAIMDAADRACNTQDCDLGPSLGGAAFFVASTLIFVVLIGGGYVLRTRRAPHHQS